MSHPLPIHLIAAPECPPELALPVAMPHRGRPRSPQEDALMLADQLRNSMSVMVTLAHLMSQDPALSEDTRSLCSLLRRQVDRMVRHVQDLECWAGQDEDTDLPPPPAPAE